MDVNRTSPWIKNRKLLKEVYIIWVSGDSCVEYVGWKMNEQEIKI